jgi:hypothetical protein
MAGFCNRGRGSFPIKRENTMIMRQGCVYMVMMTGIFLFAGCAFLADKPQGEAQLDSTTLGTQSKSLTGSPRDVGSDGSIKPHPHPSYNVSQEPDSRTGGTITLDAPIDMPNMRMDPIKGSTEGSGSNSTRSSGGARGRGSK